MMNEFKLNFPRGVCTTHWRTF